MVRPMYKSQFNKRVNRVMYDKVIKVKTYE